MQEPPLLSLSLSTLLLWNSSLKAKYVLIHGSGVNIHIVKQAANMIFGQVTALIRIWLEKIQAFPLFRISTRYIPGSVILNSNSLPSLQTLSFPL